MKKSLRVSIISLAGIFLCLFGGISLLKNNCSADCGGVETTIIECDSEDPADGICHLLNLILEILAIGIGILGVVGISISGIQYLTSSGNEEKARKAKRRLLEIVIGLAIYAMLATIIAFLFPKGGFCGEDSAGGGSSEESSKSETKDESKKSAAKDREPSEVLP